MIEIKVKSENTVRSIAAHQGESVLQALQHAGILLPAPCNGRGTCGKCRIRVQGESKDCLACQIYPQEGMIIDLFQGQNNMEVLSVFFGREEHREDERDMVDSIHSIKYMVAVDLGTTTVVVQLLRFTSELPQGEVLQTIRSMNPQSTYGADVLSRISAAVQGDARQLQSCICKLLCDSIEQLCANNDLTVKDLELIAVGGNTTMIHLMRGYNVSKLGRYPFEPVTLELEQFPYQEMKRSACVDSDEMSGGIGSACMDGNELKGCMVTVMPGISAFVGGDITAGIYALEMHKKDGIHLLIDLGTNGEIALGSKEKILVTSAAAGPAFEGGNLSCGVGSIPGAIKEVTVKKRYVACETIDNRPAVGLCGSGAVSLLAELWSKGWMDEHGSFLNEELRRDGFLVNSMGSAKILFTQEDVRQMQLAKAAIRAGIETLLKAYEISADQIKHVYLAGGMGVALDLQKAAAIGLILPELLDCTTAVGNSCLGGIHHYLAEVAAGRQLLAQRELKELTGRTASIQLAEQDVFTQDYLAYMNFH